MFSIYRATLMVAVFASIGAEMVYGHVTVLPKQSTAGKAETYTLRVPTEKSVPTVRIEVDFPEALEVSSFEHKTGWKVDERKNGVGKVVRVVLTGSIPPAESVQFIFTARNPSAEGRLSFKAIQIYQDGSRVEWTGAEGSPTAAPAIEVKK
jgi:uncharacterized protein YcnI